MANSIKVIQHNIGRGVVSSELLALHARETSIDIVLLQEPAVQNDRLCGFAELTSRIALSKPHARRGIHKSVYGSAIVVLNLELTTISRNDLITENFTIIQLHLQNQDITFISAYFKFNVPTQTHVNELSTILDNIYTPVVICMDANAHSTMWFSRATDAKGECIENLLQTKNLHCANTRAEVYTFSGPRFASNIDITLASMEVASNITNWKVDDKITSSDHAVISFELSVSPLPPFENRSRRFNDKRADWGNFISSLSQYLGRSA